MCAGMRSKSSWRLRASCLLVAIVAFAFIAWDGGKGLWKAPLAPKGGGERWYRRMSQKTLAARMLRLVTRTMACQLPIQRTPYKYVVRGGGILQEKLDDEAGTGLRRSPCTVHISVSKICRGRQNPHKFACLMPAPATSTYLAPSTQHPAPSTQHAARTLYFFPGGLCNAAHTSRLEAFL
jgi:hypothetical protein